MQEAMLSTIDNPYNPFTHFDEWLAYDTLNGYNTLGVLGANTPLSVDLPGEINDVIINDAIDYIVLNDLTGTYIKVFKPKEE